MTPERRAALIEHARANIAVLRVTVQQSAFREVESDLKADLQLAEIALASLQAVPVGEMVRFTDRVTGEVSEWRLSKNVCGDTEGFQYRTETKPIYDAPPVTGADEVRQRPVRYLNRYTGVCVTLEQQPDAATDTAVYIPLIACPASAVNMEVAE